MEFSSPSNLRKSVPVLAGRPAEALVQAQREAAHRVDVEAGGAAPAIDGHRQVEQPGLGDGILGEGPRVQVDARALGENVAGTRPLDPHDGAALALVDDQTAGRHGGGLQPLFQAVS